MDLKKSWAPDRGEVIWINCSPQVGKEMKDFHPLLVLSPRAFNVHTGIVIGLPMTTADFNETNPFAIKIINNSKKVSYILTHQPKSFDWRMRGAKPHPMKTVGEAVLRNAYEALNQIIEL